LPNSIEDEVLACLPHLRAFARSLTGSRDLADDLAQEAVLRALTAADRFTLGTNFKAWIFAILRNLYFSELRRNRPILQPIEAAEGAAAPTMPAQQAGLEFNDFKRAFNTLPAEQREALALVGGDGFKYDEAAAICGCAVGTIKSRVARGRRELERLLGTDETVAGPAGQREALPPRSLRGQRLA
jgi:RNA polymerase sigma-70 factor (ECF subfamily)